MEIVEVVEVVDNHVEDLWDEAGEGEVAGDGESDELCAESAEAHC